MKREGSPYDLIFLHKVNLRDGGNKAILVLPGTWSSGEQLVTTSWYGVRYTTPDIRKFKEILVPTIAFVIERFGLQVFDSERLPPNSEVISLKGYGHLDVYTGLESFFMLIKIFLYLSMLRFH
ncbi:hypothetical protein [Saccharolobus islandicus]|uniref:Uncharacterized protein n=1 Tax=Saccharolobus islandicus (strain M.16.27) TaxID=427318 RepID=C3N1E9_SACI3|nr:hypothetical protein [Sulfolobus islandicus]ACP54334.1 hypothetical protein M1627_0307 [Sulfolobus islandicus M.16.27]